MEIGEGRRSQNGDNEIQVPNIMGKVVGSIEILISKVYPQMRVRERLQSGSVIVRYSILGMTNGQASSTYY